MRRYFFKMLYVIRPKIVKFAPKLFWYKVHKYQNIPIPKDAHFRAMLKKFSNDMKKFLWCTSPLKKKYITEIIIEYSSYSLL